MKIAFDNQTFCLQSYGGISRYFTELGSELHILGQDAKFFAGLHQNNYLTKVDNQVFGKKIPYPRRGRGYITRFNSVFCDLAINFWKPDIVHRTYYNHSKSQIPTILTVYDMIHELFSEEFGQLDKTTQLKQISVANADHIIAISQSTKNDLVRLFGVPESKVSVVYLGFLAQENTQIIQTTRKVKEPYLLYVGQRDGYKNFGNLLKVYQDNPRLHTNFKLVVFGGGNFRSNELEKINALGSVANNIINIQGSDDVLINLYQNAEVFVYPSLYEGFGIPPLEAMAQGCPVVCSNTSSIPEVVGNAAFMFTPTDIDEMSAKIENIVFDADLREKFVHLGKQQIKKFSWQECAKQTLQIYERVV